MNKIKFGSIFCVSVVVAGVLLAQAPRPGLDATPIDVDRGTAGLDRWLRALSTRASILMVTAHPDDEDGGMLAYETRGVGARGTLLTLNRGEGGQNEMSSDMYDREGLVRTQELMQADRYYGVDQYWTRAIDYGFSKTREEALAKWDHERVLADVVRVIRMTRPLVITSVFVGAATDGHGNHQVAGEVAQEAYLAAGDPNRFPEQIRDEGLQPWKPMKVYARVPFFAITPKGMYDYAIDKYVPVRFFDYVNEKWSDTRPTANIEIQEGDYSAAAGLSYLQIGRAGLANQKSQNGGIALPPPGAFASAYHRYGARVSAADQEKSFFDGIDTSVEGIASLAPDAPGALKSGLAEISADVKKAVTGFRPDRPQEIAPALAEGLKRTQALIAEMRSHSIAEPGKANVIYELEQKQMQFGKALTVALGLSLQATVMPDKPAPSPFGPMPSETFTVAIPGQSFNVQAQLVNEGGESVEVKTAQLKASDGKAWTIAAKPAGELKSEAGGRFGVRAPVIVSVAPATVAARQDAKFQFGVTVAADASLTRPYFSRNDEEQPYYNIDDPRYRNLPLAPYPLAATLEVSYDGAVFPLSEAVQTFQRTSGLGLLPNPLLVGPAISVTLAPSAGAIPLGTKSFSFGATVHSNVKGPAQGTLRLELPAGWMSSPESAPFALNRDGEDAGVAFTVTPGAIAAGEFKITAVAEYQGKSYREGYRLVGYSGLRPYPFYRPSVYRAVGVDVKTAPGLRIGYLPGTGDEVPNALEDLRLNVRILAASDVAQADLSGYDAILLGPRAYAVRPELKSANNRLLEYVKNGGVLIVQYNLQGFDRDYGPYPFSLGENPQKVVDEGSKVVFPEPGTPVFAWPNRITKADFSGWVEERGHGFMNTWDKRYQPLVETHDPDQDPQLGGLLLARYGKGVYIYDAFALYRQLPVGVPGAYRILANLVSLGKNPGWEK
ncbi:MAG TPA: PIG-L family deacetylase [Bryobacteraceae bacterium]